MALAYTLHSILRAKKELPVNAVIDFSDKDHADLLILGAIREPSEAEIQLHELSAGAPKKADAKSSKKSASKPAQGEAASNSQQNGGGSKSDGSGEADKDPEVEAGDLDI